MEERKTLATEADVKEFLESVEDDRQREESARLLEVMGRISGAAPVMYGSSIVGFGRSMIEYADGRKDEWFSVGFSPRKGKFSLYVLDDAEKHQEVLARLGKCKTGKACLWVKKLDDVDMGVLEEIIEGAVEKDRERGYM
ncbi:MAG: DUF1801 domain-containing protein [Spirochaetales bacterium]